MPLPITRFLLSDEPDNSLHAQVDLKWEKKQIQDVTKKTILWRDLQDGRGVRRGDHLPPQKYIRNTSTCGTAPTKHLLNAGRRPQTSQKARNSPCNWPCG